MICFLDLDNLDSGPPPMRYFHCRLSYVLLRAFCILLRILTERQEHQIKY